MRPLLGGTGTPYIIPDEVIYDPLPLLRFWRSTRSRILFTPSLLQLLLDSVEAEEIAQRLGRTLTLVWLCGEVVTLELRNRFCATLPRCCLVNPYSISECHDVSAIDLHVDSNLAAQVCAVRHGDGQRSSQDLGGEDGRDGQCTLGVPGVYVGGPVLARGYLNQPEKTAERFVADPTGDVCSTATRDVDRRTARATVGASCQTASLRS